MRIWWGIVLLFGCLCGRAADARAHPLLDQAVAAYEEADFAAALRMFDDAAHNADLTVDELLQLFEMRALVHHAIGDDAAMRDDLYRLGAVRPTYRLGRLTPPSVRKAFHDMLEQGGGTLGVELVIEEELIEGTPHVVARVDGAPDGLVDHVSLHCRVTYPREGLAHTAKGTLVRLPLSRSAKHDGCDATANTRQGGVLFGASLEGTSTRDRGNVFRRRSYRNRADEGDTHKRKRWPWFVAAAGVALVGGVTAGVVLSRRSNDSQPAGSGVTVNW